MIQLSYRSYNNYKAKCIRQLISYKKISMGIILCLRSDFQNFQNIACCTTHIQLLKVALSGSAMKNLRRGTNTLKT